MAKLTDLPNEVLDNILASILHGKTMLYTTRSSTYFQLCDLLRISRHLFSAGQVMDMMLRTCTLQIENDDISDCECIATHIIGLLQPGQAELVQRLHLQRSSIRSWFLPEKFPNVREIVIDMEWDSAIRFHFPPNTAMASLIQDLFKQNRGTRTDDIWGNRRASIMEVDTTLEDLASRPIIGRKLSPEERRTCEDIRKALQSDYGTDDPWLLEMMVDNNIIGNGYHSLLSSLVQKFLGCGISVIIRARVSLSHSWPLSSAGDIHADDVEFGSIKCLSTFRTSDTILRIYIGTLEVCIPQNLSDSWYDLLKKG